MAHVTEHHEHPTPSLPAEAGEPMDCFAVFLFLLCFALVGTAVLAELFFNLLL